MQVNVSTDQKAHERTDIDLTLTERRAMRDRTRSLVNSGSYVGTDGDGAHHYFSMTARTMVVFETAADTDPDTYDVDRPGNWRVFVERKRGWQHCLIDSPDTVGGETR